MAEGTVHVSTALKISIVVAEVDVVKAVSYLHENYKMAFDVYMQ